MRIYKHDDLRENGFITLMNLISVLNVKVTRSTVNHVKSYVDYPSMACLSDALSEWGIENIGVKVSSSQLLEIPLPAISHLNIWEGKFVVLHECSNRVVKYIDSQSGWITEPIDEFKKK